MKEKCLKCVFAIFFYFLFCQLQAQGDGIKPQIWSNLYVGWNINERFTMRNALSYNVLLYNPLPWNEISFFSNGIYNINSFMEGNGGIYFASTRQTKEFSSLEIRPFIGVRFSTKRDKRWFLSNYSRLEWRNLWYSKGNSDHSVRFRNRTSIAISLNKKSLTMDNDLSLYSYFEPFYNFENEIRERFFKQFKYKIGFLYRLSMKWRFDIGMLYQDSKNNSSDPSTMPTNIITNYIFDWGIVYIIDSKSN